MTGRRDKKTPGRQCAQADKNNGAGALPIHKPTTKRREDRHHQQRSGRGTGCEAARPAEFLLPNRHHEPEGRPCRVSQRQREEGQTDDQPRTPTRWYLIRMFQQALVRGSLCDIAGLPFRRLGINDNMTSISAKSVPPSRGGAKRVVIVVYPGVTLLDAAGPAQVFASANEAFGKAEATPRYRVVLTSPAGREIQTDTGIALGTVSLRQASAKPIDTLIVAGGGGVSAALVLSADPIHLWDSQAGRGMRFWSLHDWGVLDGSVLWR